MLSTISAGSFEHRNLNLLFKVWGKYGRKLGDLAEPDNRQQALHCLNELITNALELVPDCIAYMTRLHNQSVFNFCAIPQVGQHRLDLLLCDAVVPLSQQLLCTDRVVSLP